MVQAVVLSFLRIRKFAMMLVLFLRTKVTEIVDLVLNRIIVWLCRHYMGHGDTGDMFYGQ